MAEPGTIQFSTESVGGGALGAQPGVPQVGIQGGGTGTVGPVRSGASWFDSVGGMTTELGGNLPEFIEQAFAPALQATARKREWEGFVAARAGKTAEEINESKPWYSKLFGPSNYEIGVATYTVQKQAADIEADLIRRMPELRKLTPQQWADELNALSEQHLTGNPYADTVLRKTLMDRAGPLTDLYTKERSAFENQELLKLQVDASTAAVDAYQLLASNVAQLGADHPDMPEMAERLMEAKMSLIDSLTPSAFQTDESVGALYSAVASHAARGNFYALGVIEDAGYRDALTVEQREQFDAVTRQARAQWLANRPIDDPTVRDRAQLAVEASRGILSAEEVLALAHDVNRRHAARTGDREPLVDTNDATSLTGSALSAFYASLEAEGRAARAAQEKADTEAERERLRQEAVLRAADSWKVGNIGQLIHAQTVTKDDAEQAAMSHYLTNPAEALIAQVNSYAFPEFRWVSESVKKAVQQGIQVDPDLDWTPAFHNSYEKFKIMEQHRPTTGLAGTVDSTSGPNAAREIFGDDNVVLFREYERLLGQNVEPATAYKMAQRIVSRDPVGRGNVSQSQYDQLLKELKPSNPVWRAITGEVPLTYKGELTRVAVQEIPKLQGLFPGKSEEWYAEAARKRAEVSGIDIAGEFTWKRRPDQRPITSYGGEVSPDVYGTALRQYMAGAARKSNVDMDSDDSVLLVFRQEDQEGFPVLVMMAQDKMGRTYQGTFRKADFERVQREAEELVESRRAADFEMMKSNALFQMRSGR